MEIQEAASSNGQTYVFDVDNLTYIYIYLPKNKINTHRIKNMFKRKPSPSSLFT